MLKYLMLAVTLLIVSVVSCSWVDRTSTTIKNEIGSKLSTTKEEVATLNTGIVQGIYCDSNNNGHYIYVLIEPTNAEANQTYIVSLYEKGQFRQINTISWNQPEINIKKAKLVSFNASDEEFSAYYPEYRLPLLDVPEGSVKQQLEALYQTKSLSSIFSATIAPKEPVSLLSYRSFSMECGIYPELASINQPIVIKVNVHNGGEELGEYKVILKINGKVEKIATMSICAKCTYPAEFTITENQIGTYTVDICGQFKDKESCSFRYMVVVKDK